MMVRRNVLAGVVLLAIGLGYGVLTADLPDRTLPGTPGPAFLPWLITAGWLALSTALLVRGLLGGGKKSDVIEYHIPTQSWLALVGFAAYLLLLPTLGFIVASILFFAGLTWLYGERNKLLIALTAIIIPIVLFYLFAAGFQVLLPRGLWG
ncbi:MAG: tripartite tricarboxylate transporter TctB family protein [Pseudomonadota bacterium]|jgi:hypothetical protein|nr:tripartite tricarboxylate transporter TctB family protein [Pseudomonadota bacterium]